MDDNVMIKAHSLRYLRMLCAKRGECGPKETVIVFKGDFVIVPKNIFKRVWWFLQQVGL